MSKIMRVYYDNAGHPYKDYSLSTLYPIVGNEFTGANNTTEIHFYTDNLGIATWVANCKLPNGSLLNRLLVPEIDGDGHTYFNLPLDSELTSVVGHLKIGLNGYAGNISIDEEELENNDLVVISGTPTIIATGIIDIAMNYSPITIPISSLTPTEYQELLAIIGSKLDSNKGIIVVEQLDNDNVVGSNGQLVYDKTTKLFYRVVNGAYQLENIDIGELQVNGNKLKLVLNGIASDISDINSALATKLDKIYTANKLYGTDDVGQQKAYTIMDIVNQVEITTLNDYYNKAQVDAKDDAIKNQIETLKRNAYVVVNTETYPYIDEFLDSEGEEGYLYLYPIYIEDLSKGYYQYIWEDADIGDSHWIYLGSTQLDLTPYYNNHSSLIPSMTLSNSLGDSYHFFTTAFVNTIRLYGAGSSATFSWDEIDSRLKIKGPIYVKGGDILTDTDNTYSLGTTAVRWKDIYLGGNISDGEHSTTFTNIFGALFNSEFQPATELRFGRTNVGSKSANTTFTLQTPPHFSTTPEYKGEITNGGASSITLTFTGVSNIMCNDDNIVIVNGTDSTLTLPVGTTIEFSIVNGKMVAINWSAN